MDKHHIQRMTPGGVGEIVFETAIEINQPANTSQDHITAILPLNATGRFYLQATLFNSLGQTLAESSYPFSK